MRALRFFPAAPVITSAGAVALGLACLAARLCAQEAPPAAAVETTAGASFNYIRGDYGLDDDTTVFATIASLAHDRPTWRVRANVPFLTVEGPAAVVAGGGSDVPSRPTTSSESGLGDLTLEGTYKFLPATSATGLDFTGRIKLPTADEAKGLGTGETDLYLQTEARRRVGRAVLFGTLGYRFLGDNATYALEDGAYASAGAATTLNGGNTVGLSLDWRQRLTEGGDAAVEATAFAARRLGQRWRLVGYALTGFTDASPDVGIGALAGYRF